MKVEQKKYNFIQMEKKQYLSGWIMVAMFLGLMRYFLVEPLLKVICGENSSIIYLSGFIKSTLVLILMVILFKKNIKKAIDDFLNSSVKENIMWIWKGVGIYCLLKIIYAFGFGILMSIKRDEFSHIIAAQPANENYLEMIQTMFPVFCIICIVFVSPMVEELLFRYVIYDTFRKINKYFAIIMTSVFFAGIHVLEELMAGQYIQALYYGAGYLIISLTLSIVYEKRKNVVYCICLHIIYNTVSTVL